MSALRGGALELAIARAARQYRREKRCALVRQYPPLSTDGDGTAFFSGQAPIDFLGAHFGGRALAVEAKSDKGKSLACSRLRDDQRGAMGVLHDLGADVRLVVCFTAQRETYSIAWPEVAAFLSAPWRASWSLAWCRAVGLLLPEVDADNSDRRRVMFLDGAAHPARDRALQLLERERAQAAQRPAVEPEPLDLDLPSPPPKSEYAGLTVDEVRERLRRAAEDGVQRQLKRPRRRFKPGRRTA